MIYLECDKCGYKKEYEMEEEFFGDGVFYGVNDDLKGVFGEHETLCGDCL
tara:strand:+ start:396 stop:545 length:150 start_codon:yes stop_codon:yes gene_type:complete